LPGSRETRRAQQGAAAHSGNDGPELQVTDRQRGHRLWFEVLLVAVVHLVCPPGLWRRKGLWVAGRGQPRRLVDARAILTWRQISCGLINRLVVGGRTFDPGPFGTLGLRCFVVQVSHDLGEYRIMVEPVGRVPGVGIVHV